MVFLALYGVLRGFPAATYIEYASPQTLVRPCPTLKIRISELDTTKCQYLVVDGHYLYFTITVKDSPGQKRLDIYNNVDYYGENYIHCLW